MEQNKWFSALFDKRVRQALWVLSKAPQSITSKYPHHFKGITHIEQALSDIDYTKVRHIVEDTWNKALINIGDKDWVEAFYNTVQEIIQEDKCN